MHKPMLTIAIDTISNKLLEARDLAKKSRAKRPSKLTAAGAMALHVADVTVTRLNAAVELAEETRALIRERYRDVIPLSKDPDEAKKGVCVTEVGGFSIRISPVAGSDRFSLSDYKKAGHKVTAAMREAMKPSKDYDKWTVKDVRGPRRADAIEPSSVS